MIHPLKTTENLSQSDSRKDTMEAHEALGGFAEEVDKTLIRADGRATDAEHKNIQRARRWVAAIGSSTAPEVWEVSKNANGTFRITLDLSSRPFAVGSVVVLLTPVPDLENPNTLPYDVEL